MYMKLHMYMYVYMYVHIHVYRYRSGTTCSYRLKRVSVSVCEEYVCTYYTQYQLHTAYSCTTAQETRVRYLYPARAFCSERTR